MTYEEKAKERAAALRRYKSLQKWYRSACVQGLYAIAADLRRDMIYLKERYSL